MTGPTVTKWHTRGCGMKLVPDDLIEWTKFARQDDWYMHFVGSDIRCMLGEIDRLRRQVQHLEDLVAGYKNLMCS